PGFTRYGADSPGVPHEPRGYTAPPSDRPDRLVHRGFRRAHADSVRESGKSVPESGNATALPGRKRCRSTGILRDAVDPTDHRIGGDRVLLVCGETGRRPWSVRWRDCGCRGSWIGDAEGM